VEPDENSLADTVAEAERTLRERRPTAENSDQLMELMRLTCNTRRAWIVDRQPGPTITEICQRYPRLVNLPNAVSTLHDYIIVILIILSF